jgi:DNA relaxase NicK
MVKVSGEQARLNWREVFQESTNVSRLDVQTTVRFDVAQPSIVQELHGDAIAYRPTNGRPTSKTLIQSSTKGDTLYLGQRVSDVYCRAYDKGIESKTAEAGLLLRYEVEFKRRRARQVAMVLSKTELTGTESAGIVSNVFSSRGVRVPTSIDELRLDASSLPVAPHHLKFAWLGRAVRPSVEALLRVYSRDELIAVLGLEQPTSSEAKER